MTAPRFTVRRWTQNSQISAAAALGLVVILALLPLAFGANVTERLTTLFIYLILAAMWNALAGYAGLISVGQQMFFGLAAYATIRLSYSGMPVYFAILIGAGAVWAYRASAVGLHAAAARRRVRDRHLGDRRHRASAGQFRSADPGRNRQVADRA